MPSQIFQLIGLYSLYYIGIPGLLFVTIWRIKQKSDFIKGSIKFGGKEKVSAEIESEKSKLKKLQILFVVLLLISVPALNLTFYGIQDISMHRTRSYASEQTIFPGHIDRVGSRIGPTFDTEAVIKQMEDAEHVDWYLEDIRDQIDLDKLVRSAGRITIYKLKRTLNDHERVVINYAYLSPIPMTRYIEFVVVKGEAFLEADNLVVYPMPPSMAASF